MIQLENVNNQLKVTKSGVVHYYLFEDFKSVTPYYGPSGDAIIINFINENRDSSLRLPFVEIDSPVWVDVNEAVGDISKWANASTNGLLATEATLQGVANNTGQYVRNAYVERTTASGGNTQIVYSISFSNVGAANVTVQGSQLEPGETINFDAGGLNNYFDVATLSWSVSGSELLIIYVAD